ncbi:MAG: hypothetical protein AB7D35_07685 [Bacteroidales bacterium]
MQNYIISQEGYACLGYLLGDDVVVFVGFVMVFGVEGVLNWKGHKRIR